MRNLYPSKSWLFVSGLFLILLGPSCKKDHFKPQPPPPPVSGPKKLGLFELDSSIFKELDINVSKIGNQGTSYHLVFDTGSAGMVIDAEGILPQSMITCCGFKLSGDSTVINGITITSQTSVVQYGVD